MLLNEYYERYIVMRVPAGYVSRFQSCSADDFSGITTTPSGLRCAVMGVAAAAVAATRRWARVDLPWVADPSAADPSAADPSAGAAAAADACSAPAICAWCCSVSSTRSRAMA